MRVITHGRLKEFWEQPGNADAKSPLKAWYQAVKEADWTCFADVRRTYRSADAVGKKVVFDIGGNKYRLIAAIDYEGHTVFIRHVLSHKDYDHGDGKKDAFGEHWKPRSSQAADTPKRKKGEGRAAGGKRSNRGRGRGKK